MFIDTGRNLGLKDLVERLEAREHGRIDAVAAAGNLRSEGGQLVIDGIPPTLMDTGVSCADGVYTLAPTAETAMGERLGIPPRYLRTMREGGMTDLYDTNVNRWLERDPDRSFLVRTVADSDGGPGRVRAFLSDRYLIVDDLDVLAAALQGIESTGIEADVTGGDLTERHMYVRLEAPAIAARSPELLRSYRSPFTGQSGDELPLISAGLEVSNSEVGDGSFNITPRLVVQVCTNGLTMHVDAHRKVHIGSKMEAGEIAASDRTREAAREFIVSRAADAVRHFLSPTYVNGTVERLAAEAGKPVDDAKATVPAIVQKLGFAESTRDLVFEHFIRGGARTAGGIMHAMTSAAQVIDDAETAHALEAQAVKSMSLV